MTTKKKKRTRQAYPEIYERYILDKYKGKQVVSPITGETLVVETMGDLCWDNLNDEEKGFAVSNGWGWGIKSKDSRGRTRHRGVLYRPTVQKWLTFPGRYSALWGGFDTGKTYAACLDATWMAVSFPASKTVFYRDTYPQLLQTTLLTLEKLFKDLGLKEGVHWRHRPNDKYRYYEITIGNRDPSYICLLYTSPSPRDS